ncbi:hypothetical protein BASA62_005593 [Batrachochytrium salamandrivorans]|nr:hypothetical protein BASA62_005593 [Batrachochytrium salamandrivorans]
MDPYASTDTDPPVQQKPTAASNSHSNNHSSSHSNMYSSANPCVDPMRQNSSFLDDESWTDVDPTAAQMDLVDSITTIDFYGILNVDHKATDDDIKNAYKRLCITFHPDKYMKESDKSIAQRKFQSVQRAYSAIPEKRYIYDLYGEAALDQSWEVGPQRKSPEAIREEYEHRARIKRDLEAIELVKSRGEITLTLDATSYFQPSPMATLRFRDSFMGLPVASHRSFYDLMVLPEIQKATVTHEWETRLDPTTDIILSGKVQAYNGHGNGAVGATIRHVLSPNLWGEASLNISHNPSAEFKVVRNFSSDIFMTVHGDMRTVYRPPDLTIVVGRRITTNSTGYLRYQPGSFCNGLWGPRNLGHISHTACTVGMVHNMHGRQWDFDLHAGVSGSRITLSHTRPIAGRILTRIELSAMTSGDVVIGINGDHRVDRHTRIGMGINCSVESGVFLQLKVSRLGQKIKLPILLTPELDLRLAFLTLTVSLLSGIAFDRLVLKPWRDRRMKTTLGHIRQKNAKFLQERCMDAQQAIELMRESVARRVEVEESRTGLVIIQALYGKLPISELASVRALSPQGIKDMAASIRKQIKSVLTPDSLTPPELPSNDYIDVAIPVQSLVQGGQLHISGGHSKSSIIGFWDPCLGEKKRLRITYQFHGRVHQIEVDDKTAVAAPLREPAKDIL